MREQGDQWHLWLCVSVCPCECPRSKRKTTTASNTKLDTHTRVLHGRNWASVDLEVKRLKVKVTGLRSLTPAWVCMSIWLVKFLVTLAAFTTATQRNGLLSVCPSRNVNYAVRIGHISKWLTRDTVRRGQRTFLLFCRRPIHVLYIIVTCDITVGLLGFLTDVEVPFIAI